jgi:hypothetical protein
MIPFPPEPLKRPVMKASGDSCTGRTTATTCCRPGPRRLSVVTRKAPRDDGIDADRGERRIGSVPPISRFLGISIARHRDRQPAGSRRMQERCKGRSRADGRLDRARSERREAASSRGPLGTTTELPDRLVARFRIAPTERESERPRRVRSQLIRSRRERGARGDACVRGSAIAGPPRRWRRSPARAGYPVFRTINVLAWDDEDRHG